MMVRYSNALIADGNLDTQKNKIGGSYEPPIFIIYLSVPNTKLPVP